MRSTILGRHHTEVFGSDGLFESIIDHTAATSTHACVAFEIMSRCPMPPPGSACRGGGTESCGWRWSPRSYRRIFPFGRSAFGPTQSRPQPLHLQVIRTWRMVVALTGCGIGETKYYNTCISKSTVMNTWVILTIVAVLGSGLTISVASSQSDAIPDWIKTAAGWWSEGAIGDADYLANVQWLVDEGYITLGASEDSTFVVRESLYRIEQLSAWERQIPNTDEMGESTRDSMVHTDTIENDIPATISVTMSRIVGENIDEHREWGMELIQEYLGDAFNHTSVSTAIIDGNSGYVDEYTVVIFNFGIQGISYSFEHEGMIYEVKYESDIADYDTHLAEAERIIQTFQLEN